MSKMKELESRLDEEQESLENRRFGIAIAALDCDCLCSNELILHRGCKCGAFERQEILGSNVTNYFHKK